MVVEEIFEGLLQVGRDGEVPPHRGRVGGVDVHGPVAAHHQPGRAAAVHRRQIRRQEPAATGAGIRRPPDVSEGLRPYTLRCRLRPYTLRCGTPTLHIEMSEGL